MINPVKIKFAADASVTKIMSPELASLLVKQVGNEMFASYTYLAMAVWLDSIGLTKLSAQLNTWSQEELCHAHKVLDFLMNTGEANNLPNIEAPDMKFDSVVAMAEKVLEHEKGVTADWNNISTKAKSENCNGLMKLANWFTSEQVEEENKADVLVQRAKLAGEGSGLLVLESLY